MRIRALRVMGGGLFLAVAIAGACVIVSPNLRWRAYFALLRGLETHWPLSLGRRLPTRWRPFFLPKPAWVQLEPQVKMLLDPNDHVSRRIAENGVWEPETWRVVEPHLQRGATLVDVGAHIGYYSLKAAGRVGPNGRVIAIEPDPDTVRKLQENIRANDARNITVQPVACAGSEAILEFFAARNNPTISSISRANASEGAISIRVRARPLDAILHDVATSRVDVLKIDVEGAELQVLKGAQETLTRYHPLLVVELIDGQLREVGTSSAEVTDFLRVYGYVVRHSGLDGMNTEFVYQTGTP